MQKNLPKKRTHSKCPACNPSSSGGGWFSHRAAAKKSECELCKGKRMVKVDVAYRFIQAMNNTQLNGRRMPTAKGYAFSDNQSLHGGRRTSSANFNQ